MGCHNMCFSLAKNCSLKSVKFVRDRTLKLLLLLLRGEVVLELELNILVPRSRMLGKFREVKH